MVDLTTLTSLSLSKVDFYHLSQLLRHRKMGPLADRITGLTTSMELPRTGGRM